MNDSARRSRRRWAALALAWSGFGLFTACGGVSSNNSQLQTPGPGGVIVLATISPKATTLIPGGQQAFTCAATAGCTWAVQESSSGGSVTTAGIYSAPTTPGTYHVVSTSKGDGSKTDTATVTVVTLSPGTWFNVTPAGISLDKTQYGNDNFGVQDVVVDPVRPQDLYAFTCHQGVWKSTNYGVTWTGPINTGTGGTMVSAGKNWAAAIDPNKNRDPNTPPTLYTAAGQAVVGILKSTDGGVSWTSYHTHNALAETSFTNAGNDVYSIDIDPYDSQHILVGFHEAKGLSESKDGGQTWSDVTVDGGMTGESLYAFFIDTGDPTTTAKTWLAIPQLNNDDAGTWRTTNAGQSWTNVLKIAHFHGNSQIFQAGSGVVYMAGVSNHIGTIPWGTWRSPDYGATWTHVNDGSTQNVVYGTSSYVYSDRGDGLGGGSDPFQRAPRTTGTSGTWSTYATPGFSGGTKRAAVTYDASSGHFIIVSGAWNAGILRYIE